jgi:hypothetical protein
MSMAKIKNKAEAQPTQSQAFIEAARALGCDEDPARFDEALKKVARHKPIEGKPEPSAAVFATDVIEFADGSVAWTQGGKIGVSRPAWAAFDSGRDGDIIAWAECEAYAYCHAKEPDRFPMPNDSQG